MAQDHAADGNGICVKTAAGQPFDRPAAPELRFPRPNENICLTSRIWYAKIRVQNGTQSLCRGVNGMNCPTNSCRFI